MSISHDKLNQFQTTRMMYISGFSMIEMMISITIGLLILAALSGVLASNSRSTKANDRTSELQTNGRYALDHLKREIRQAKYRGYTWAEPNTPTTNIAVSNECLDNSAAADAFVINIRQGIWGANDTNPFTANCLPAANRLRGDILVVRRAASTLVNTLVANTMYFRSSYAVGEVFQGTTLVSITGTPIATFGLQEYVYYIGKDDTDTSIPALRRVSMQANAMVDEEVVGSIENMQLQYGRATTDLNTQYYNASGITGYATDSGQTQWDDVNSVRIWLLARNAIAEPGYSNTNSYSMGDVTYTVNDHYRRQLFTAVVQLRN
jgi:type IV pilus assembly protein PilW